MSIKSAIKAAQAINAAQTAASAVNEPVQQAAPAAPAVSEPVQQAAPAVPAVSKPKAAPKAKAAPVVSEPKVAPVVCTSAQIRAFVLSKDEDKVLELVNDVLEADAHQRQMAKGWVETLRTDKVQAVQFKKLSKLLKRMSDDEKDELPDAVYRAVRRLERKFLADPAFMTALVATKPGAELPRYLASIGKLRAESVQPHAAALTGMVEGKDPLANILREDIMQVLCHGRKVERPAPDLTGMVEGFGTLIGSVIAGVIQAKESTAPAKPGIFDILMGAVQATAAGGNKPAA